jgi:hypothetical protein
MPIRVTDTSGMGYSSTISKGLTWAVDNGARIMNLSFGGVAGSATVRNAAQYAMDQGGLVVAAAGNCGCDDNTAETPYLFSVGATDSQDNLAYFSTRGPFVDASAPGVGIYTTSRGGGYSNVSGTSFASPVVAGVAALVASANFALTPVEIMDLLEATAVDLGPAGHDTSFGWGRVDAYAAVAAAGGLQPQPDTTAPGVAISAPAEGSIVSATVNVSVDASDDVGTVKVELYLDDILLATDTSAPFDFAWDSQTTSDGSHSLKAAALDAAGNRGVSQTAAVIVDNSVSDTAAPFVAVTAPEDGSHISGTVAVTVSASDDVGVTAVELYRDGNFLALDNTAPFVFSWDTTSESDGTHSLEAKAYDAAGNGATSAAVSVTAENKAADDVSAPSAAIISPADGATVSKLVKIKIQAIDDSQVVKLDLLVDGALERATTCATSVCEVQIPWNVRKVASGWHTLDAVAHDAAGNKGTGTIAVNIK